MEAIAAVGFAASILTFVDFSYSLVSGALKVLRTGTVPGVSDVQSLIHELQQTTNSVQQTPFPASSIHHVDALQGLTTKSTERLNEVQGILQSLVPWDVTSKFEALRISLRSKRKEGEIYKLLGLLEQYRSDGFTYLSSHRQ